ncbi:MAG: hypothetical protein WAU10_01795 [Caldilineaceae bacterium]
MSRPLDRPTDRPHDPLYTLRLWPEVLDAEHWEWRGELKDLNTGEVRYFRRWSEVVELLVEMLGETTESPDVQHESYPPKGENT